MVNVFWMLLFSAIVASNFFYLYIDNSRRKRILLFWIIVQIAASVYVILMVQLFNTKTFNFVTIDM